MFSKKNYKSKRNLEQSKVNYLVNMKENWISIKSNVSPNWAKIRRRYKVLARNISDDISALKENTNIKRWSLALLHQKEVLKVNSRYRHCCSCLKYAKIKSSNILKVKL